MGLLTVAVHFAGIVMWILDTCKELVLDFVRLCNEQDLFGFASG